MTDLCELGIDVDEVESLRLVPVLLVASCRLEIVPRLVDGRVAFSREALVRLEDLDSALLPKVLLVLASRVFGIRVGQLVAFDDILLIQLPERIDLRNSHGSLREAAQSVHALNQLRARPAESALWKPQPLLTSVTWMPYTFCPPARWMRGSVARHQQTSSSRSARALTQEHALALADGVVGAIDAKDCWVDPKSIVPHVDLAAVADVKDKRFVFS